MKSAKISFLHKNRLIIGSKPHLQPEEKATVLSINSIPILLPEKVKKNSFNSKQKQNSKPKTYQNVQELQEKPIREIKFRSASSIMERKAFQSLSHMKEQIRQEKMKQTNKIDVVEGAVLGIIEDLRKKFIIFQNHLTTYTIKKDHFQNLLNHFIFQIARDGNDEKKEKFSYLLPHFEEIRMAVAANKKQADQKKNGLHSGIVTQNINGEDFCRQISKRVHRMEDLVASQSKLEREIRQMASYKEEIQKESKEKQVTIMESLKMIEKVKMDLQNYQQEKNILWEQLEKHRDEAAKTKEASKRVQDFVYNQQNKLLAMASDEYKAIQSEIYEYASYLQCNQLASGVDYQPLTITCITNELEEKLKDINRTLIQREELDSKEKGKMMRDFLMEWMNRFKKKDQEQKELLKFKSKCVQTFVGKMKRWLDNWTLKQQYLVRLRDQFSIDTAKLQELISQLSTSQPCDKCSPSIFQLGGHIKTLYDKIQNNYKLGNSFY